MVMRAPVSPTHRHYCSRMVTCFTCGLPSSKEWAQIVSTRPNAPKRPYFPFLVQIQPPPGAVLEADGTTLVCAFCHASLLAQWRHFEQQAAASGNQTHIRRVYSLGKFLCGVCGVTTYRKRVRTLPVQEFPFLSSQRPNGSLTFGNNLLALVCLDCYETLRTQNEEYDRWGFPLQKRRFNWLARQPPHPDSPEASVARLPCGKMKIPSCPPTEPYINPSTLTDRGLANTMDASTIGLNQSRTNASALSGTAAAASRSGESETQSRTRKLSVVYTSNPFIDSTVRVHSPQSGTDVPIAGSQTPKQEKHKATPAMPIKPPEIIHTRTLSSPSGTHGRRSRSIVSVIPSDMMCPPGSIRGSTEYLSSSLPNGTVLVPAVIYHPRRKLSPHSGRRYSSALSLYPSTAPYRIPAVSSVKSCDSPRSESPSSMRMPYPKSSTAPWVPLQKLCVSGNMSVKRRRFSETVTQEAEPSCTRKYSDSRIMSHAKSIEPLRILDEGSNERGSSESNLSDLTNQSDSPQTARPSSSASQISYRGTSPEEIITQKMEQAAITEPDSTCKESFRFPLMSGNEKGIPIRKRRTGYDLAESMEVCSGGSCCSSPGAGPIMFDAPDSGVHSIVNDDEEYCAIDLSISSRKRSSIYSSDPSVRESLQSAMSGARDMDSIRRNRSMGCIEGVLRPAERPQSPCRRSSVIVELPKSDL